MAAPSTSASSRPGPLPDTGSYFGSIPELLSGFVALLKTKLQLLTVEGKEALIHFAILLGLLIGVLVALIFGYILLWLAIALLLGLAFPSNTSWLFITLAIGILHVVGAAVLGWIAKTRLASPVFATTVSELQKDQQWLSQLTLKRH